MFQGYESASASPDSTRSERQIPISTYLKHRQQVAVSLTAEPQSRFCLPQSSVTGRANISGSGDRGRPRKSLNEILEEHGNRNQITGPNGRNMSSPQVLTSPSGSRPAVATEVLSRSSYPKSDRLLQLINQPIVSATKPSYLNTFAHSNNNGQFPSFLTKQTKTQSVTVGSFN